MKTKKIVKSKLDKDKDAFHNNYLIKIPDFIDTKSEVGKRNWILLYNLSITYLDMVQDYILSDLDIADYLQEFLDYLYDLREINDMVDYFKYQIWLGDIYTDMFAMCVINEYYEACANLKKFDDIL
jgi:hypothetical protein